MSKERMCVALLLDRSGSMSAHKTETISAVNSYIEKTREKFKGRFVLTQFDSESIDIVHDGKIKDVKHLTDESYQPRGMTPLLDAIGKTLDVFNTDGFENIVFVVMTDGQENHSKEYKLDAIRAKIEEKRAIGWQISYLGANVDAFAEGASMGFARGQTMNYAGQHSVQTMAAYSANNEVNALRVDKGVESHDADFTEEQRTSAMHGSSSREGSSSTGG